MISTPVAPPAAIRHHFAHNLSRVVFMCGVSDGPDKGDRNGVYAFGDEQVPKRQARRLRPSGCERDRVTLRDGDNVPRVARHLHCGGWTVWIVAVAAFLAT